MHRTSRLLLALALALGSGVALAAPASAAVAITLTPAAADVGGPLNVAGTGCPASSPVFVSLWNTSGGGQASAAGTANGAGAFSVDLMLVSSTSTQFVPGQQVGVAAFCSTTADADAPHVIEFFTPPLASAPLVSLDVAARSRRCSTPPHRRRTGSHHPRSPSCKARPRRRSRRRRRAGATGRPDRP